MAAFIALGEAPFWARSMSHLLAIPENKVSAELARFAEGGLLVAISVAQWDRRKLYERTPAGARYWELGANLVSQAAEEEAVRQGLEVDAAMRVYLEDVFGPGGPERFRVVL